MKTMPPLRIKRFPTHDEIERLAYQIYVNRGRQPGRELDDWLEAKETLLLDENYPQIPETPKQKAHLT
jgi:hypothetical protein